MPRDRLFLDTLFVQALLNRVDQYHPQAAALSATNRAGAARFISQCYHTPNMRIVTVDRPLFLRAFSLYQSHSDKQWGLVDCISFVLMRDQGISPYRRHSLHSGGLPCPASAIKVTARPSRVLC